jgi:hypothetical protein
MPELKYNKNIFACCLIFFAVFSCSIARYENASLADEDQGTDEILAKEAVSAPAAPKEPVMAYYEGELLNIFFHPLVARPEIAFKGDMKAHFLEWFVTAEEYKKILDELYLLDYVLVDINEFYSVTYTNNIKTVEAKKFLIPEGKKPLVLSVDDLSYYEHCRKNGIVHKLIIDQNGNIAAWTDTPSGGGAVSEGEISYDLGIINNKEEIIKKHPDFSIRGAKGIIALTGYEGILGYQTQSEKSNVSGYQKEIENAIVIVNKLKELGWRFASHSWGHLNMPKVAMSWFTYDNKLWDREVKPILGETDLYIYPFGAALENIEEKHKILRDRNYNLFFGVGAGYGYRIGPKSEYIFLSRRNIDGQYFRLFRNSDKKLFDIDKVMDKQNRGIR